MPPNSPQVAVRSKLSTMEMWNTPGTSQELSPEFFPQRDEICDVTDTYTHIEFDAKTSSEQPNNSPTNRRSSKYILRHYQKLF